MADPINLRRARKAQQPPQKEREEGNAAHKQQLLTYPGGAGKSGNPAAAAL